MYHYKGKENIIINIKLENVSTASKLLHTLLSLRNSINFANKVIKGMLQKFLEAEFNILQMYVHP